MVLTGDRFLEGVASHVEDSKRPLVADRVRILVAWSGHRDARRRRATPAVADDGAAGWYAAPSYHQTGLNDASNTVKQPAGDIHLDSSFGDDTGPGLAVGYAFDGPYRVDVEYQSHSNDLKLPGTVLQSSSLDATTFVANVWRDFGPWHDLRPYAGVGFGGGTLKLNDLDGDFLFGQLGVGVEWYFSRRAALDIGYRYQQATSDRS